jgi:hypothetical protein
LSETLEDLKLSDEEADDHLQALFEVDGLKDLLLLVGGDVHVGGDEVAELAGFIDGVDHLAGLFGPT